MKDWAKMELPQTDYHMPKLWISSEPVGQRGGSISTFTISALERATGVPRSTVHFYIGQELLPRPAKMAISRSLYSETHVDLLRRITSLKESGLSLAEIKEVLRPDLERANEDEVDLGVREYGRVHKAIIEAATREFAANGYEDTHLATIIKKVGISRHVFYSHVESKAHLLAECFKATTESSYEWMKPELERNPDPAARLLARLASSPARHLLRAEAVSLIRAPLDSSNDASEALVETYGTIAEYVAEDLRDSRVPGAPAVSASIELLAYSMVGAFDNTQLRASWDDKYDRADLLRTHLWLYLVVRAALDGQVDVDSKVKRYEELIQEAASRE
jgi:AcrR family transcriptional regulator